MWFASKRAESPPAPRSVARAAAEGCRSRELLGEVLASLAERASADRAGVWIESVDPAEDVQGGSDAFEGLVWDSEMRMTPPGWSRLAPELPLPMDQLRAGACAEQFPGAEASAGVVGPLLELRRAVWAPVFNRGRLRGLLLAGYRTMHGPQPWVALRSVAAELEVALDLTEEEFTSRRRYADLALARRILSSSGGVSPAALLATLADSCTEKSLGGVGPHAVFAAIGEHYGLRESSRGSNTADVRFLWKSGDVRWSRSVESEPLASLWHAALDARRVSGAAPHALVERSDLARVVAIPIGHSEGPLGVLVAGLRTSGASLAVLEQIELRAALAAPALRARRVLRETEARNRERQALLDACGFPALLLGTDGRVLACSRSFARQHSGEAAEVDPAGAPPQAVRFQKIDGIVHEQDQQRVREWLAALPGEGDPQPLEVLLTGGTPVRLRRAGAAGADFVIVVADPLQAKSLSPATPSAERAEAELRAVTEWLDHGVLVFDVEERVRLVNTRFAQLTGIASAEAAKLETLDDWIARLGAQTDSPEQLSAYWRELARDADAGRADELHLTRPAQRILGRAARNFFDAAGRRLGRVEVYRDLTAQRLLQSRLLQTERLAALGQTVSGVAHELSNPLTSILGYAQRLLAAEGPVGRRQDVQKIFLEAERAGAILRQMLLSAREAPPERTTIDLNRLVLGTVELQQFGMAAGDIRVGTELDPSAPMVEGYAGQLQQVLLNLLSNARQAIGARRHGVVRVRTRAEGDRVRLEVADNGPGIPQAILARIFDPFFTTKPAGVGTGLGLAIVLTLVRQHGGQVHVENPAGGGALFRIDLPLSAAEPATGDSAKSPADSAMTPPALPLLHPLSTHRPTHQPMLRGAPGRAGRHAAAPAERRALVLEDEPTVAELVRDVLTDEGFAVDVLQDGSAALASASRTSYDLVVCDMRMPGMDGQQFYLQLANAPGGLQQRFLFVTGDVLAAQTHEFLERHRVRCVAKPFRVEELLEKVHSVLGEAAETARNLIARKG